MKKDGEENIFRLFFGTNRKGTIFYTEILNTLVLVVFYMTHHASSLREPGREKELRFSSPPISGSSAKGSLVPFALSAAYCSSTDGVPDRPAFPVWKHRPRLVGGAEGGFLRSVFAVNMLSTLLGLWRGKN